MPVDAVLGANPSGLAVGANVSDFGLSNVAPASLGAELNRVVIYDPAAFRNPSATDLLLKQSVFVFRINPRKASFAEGKIESPILTKAGWEKHFWKFDSDTQHAVGNKLITITFTGQTGALIPPSYLLKIGITDTRLSPAWFNFLQFQEFFRSRNGDLVMVYDGDVYEGHIDTLSWDPDADTPFLINFRWTFVAYAEKIRRFANRIPQLVSGPLAAPTFAGLGNRITGGEPLVRN